jgi:hypothetical protein
MGEARRTFCRSVVVSRPLLVDGRTFGERERRLQPRVPSTLPRFLVRISFTLVPSHRGLGNYNDTGIGYNHEGPIQP